MKCSVSYWDERKHVAKEIPLPTLEEALKFAGWHPGSTIMRAEDGAFYDRTSGEFFKFQGIA